MSFSARFPGLCPECDERIEIGDEITDHGNGSYQHVVCPEAVPEKQTRFQGTTLEEMGF